MISIQIVFKNHADAFCTNKVEKHVRYSTGLELHTVSKANMTTIIPCLCLYDLFNLESETIRISMKTSILTLALAVSCFSLFACNTGSHERVTKAEEEAQEEIHTAQKEVIQQRVESQADIEEALAQGNLAKIETAKIDATSDMANAEANLDDKKIEAEKAIAGAKFDAGETDGTLNHNSSN